MIKQLINVLKVVLAIVLTLLWFNFILVELLNSKSDFLFILGGSLWFTTLLIIGKNWRKVTNWIIKKIKN
jgi:hypothetical protein